MLEFESPSLPHEEDSQSLILLVGIVAAQLDVPIRSVGSTTFRRRDLERGFEPNGSFYIQHEAEVRGRREIDLGVHPPPDLIIEMEVSRSAIDKLALFAAMGSPRCGRVMGSG